MPPPPECNPPPSPPVPAPTLEPTVEPTVEPTSTPTPTTGPSEDVWNIDTGDNSADFEENLSFEAIEIDLGTLTVSSTSSMLVVSEDPDGTTQVLLDGETVISISEDDYGVTIDSTAPSERLIEYALFGGFSKTLTIYRENDFKLSLNSVTIDSSDGPAINIQTNSAPSSSCRRVQSIH